MAKLRLGYGLEDSARKDADEGGRSPTEEAPSRARGEKYNLPPAKNTEVLIKKTRRRLTTGYKLKILSEIDVCKTTADKNAILRREGIYSSCITRWIKERRDGKLVFHDAQEQKLTKAHCQKIITELEKENALLKNRLMQAEMIIDLQKKVSEIFGVNQNTTPLKEVK